MDKNTGQKKIVKREKYTKEQKEAVTVRDKNVLVSASAGSGKTYVLVERIIKLMIEDKISIDKLVVVTFTELSAREMKIRIKKRIKEKIKEKIEVGENIEYLLEQEYLVEIANISTIHSFCRKLIKEYFTECEVDPNFRIIDDKENSLLKKEIIVELFNDLYCKYANNVEDQERIEDLKRIDGKDFVDLIEIYGDKIFDNKLQELVLGIFIKANNNPFPMLWLEEKVESYKGITTENIDNSKWIKGIKEEVKKEIGYAVGFAREYVKISEQCNGLEPYIESSLIEKSKMEKLHYLMNEDDITYLELQNMIESIQFGRLKSIKKSDEIDDSDKDKYKIYRDKSKKIIEGLKENYFFGTIETYVDDFNKLGKHFDVLLNIVKSFNNRYLIEKKKLNVLDYNDLEQFTINLIYEEGTTINNPIYKPIAKDIQNKYEKILIDEYQDCNEIQELIFLGISKENKGIKNRFIVGDVKQSIYGFRGANPKLFVEKFNKYKKEDEADEIRIDLAENFRSREVVLEGINFIFNQIMKEELGGVTYRGVNELIKGNIDNYPPTDKNVSKDIEVVVGDLETIGDEERVKEEIEGIIICNKIKEMVSGDKILYVKDEEGYRKAQYKDIVILTKSRTHINSIMKIFKEEGIPYSGTGTGNFFESVEIQVLLNYLQIIDNPMQDIGLIAVLKSPLYGFTSDELIEIKSHKYGIDMYYCLCNACVDELLKSKIEQFLEDLEMFTAMKRKMVISELITEIVNVTNYNLFVGTLPNEKNRLSNIKMLIEKASEYEKTNYTSLFNFVSYISKLNKNKIEISGSSTNVENDNVVRFLTIHQSKGLEFPIVILALSNSQFNMMDERQNFIVHNKLGISSKAVDLEYRVETETLARNLSKSFVKKERIEEEIRVLYVALTRAEEKLIITSITKDFQKDIEKYELEIGNENIEHSTYLLERAKSFYEMIMPSIMRNKNVMEQIGIEGCGYENTNEYIENFDLKMKVEIIESIEKDKRKVEEEKEGLIDKLGEVLKTGITEEGINNIEEHLAFNYKYEGSVKLPSKISIKDIKKIVLKEDNEEKYKVDEIYATFESKITAMNKGVIIHKVIECISNEKRFMECDVDELIKDLINKKIIKEEEIKTVEKKIFYNFIKSDLYTRMLNSKEVEEEKHFVLELLAKDYYEEVEDDEKILLNGIIDCYFVEEDEIVIVDYKSDYVTDKNMDNLIKQYKVQLDIYKEVLENTTDKKVKQCIIHFLKINKSVCMI